MAKILANDGLDASGIALLENAGHSVSTQKIPQEDLVNQLNAWDAIIVRSATQVRAEHFDSSPNLKVVIRAGVGMDNIDVDYGRAKGVLVTNTPEASSRSVAELSMAHLMSLARNLHRSHAEMPATGNEEFKKLKKAYSSGFELQGKTIGIIGFGRIGQELARISLGMGMNVLAYDLVTDPRTINFPNEDSTACQISVPISTMEDLVKNSDIISVHVPSSDQAIIGAKELEMARDGVVLINTARGGSIDEDALLHALESGKVRSVALDVFNNEPKPRADILDHPQISSTPHIGASTKEAQGKIAQLAAKKIIDFFA